jgi:hypothetical protein
MNTTARRSTRDDAAPSRFWYIAALLVALIVRVAWLEDKPFWRDEAWVALLVEAPLSKVSDPHRPRPAPIGFVALAKLSGALPLPPEIGYRLPALLGGLALVPVLGWLARALGAPPPVPLVVVWLAAGAPALVYYSRELKSYGIDALSVALAALLALRCVGRGAGPGLAAGPATVGLALLVALAPWLTFGGLFGIGALLAWGSLRWWPTADAVTRRRWLLVCAIFLVSFAAAYVQALGAQSSSPRLHATWREWTFPLAKQEDAPLGQLAVAVWRYLSLSTWFVFSGAWPLLIPLAALGAAVWPARGRGLLIWLYVGTGVLAVAATLADRFLLAEGRLLLFAAPPLLLAAAAGLVAAGRRLWPARPQAIGLAIAVMLGLAWSAKAIAHRLPPYRNDPRAYFQYDTLHDVDALLDAAVALRRPGEPVFVAVYASKPYRYYRRGRLADASVCPEPCPEIGDRLDRWIRSLDDRGLLLLLDDEVDQYVRHMTARGWQWREAATVRGGRVWEVQRCAPVECGA